MKRVMIGAWKVGLVFKNGTYLRMLKEGKYWLAFGEKVEIYAMEKEFVPGVDPDILLQDVVLKDALHVLTVKDNQIALRYENGLLKAVLTAGTHLYWKGLLSYEFVHADLSKAEITENISRATLQDKLLAPYIRTSSIEAYEKAVLLVDGKYEGTLNSGFYSWWKNSLPVSVQKADMRTQQAEINGQEMLTKDKAALRINAWVSYAVIDIEKALLKNKECEKQLYVLFQLALREYVAGMSFDELLEKKETIASYILDRVGKETADLGIQVAGFGIRDIILPGEVKDIMNQVLIAEKKAQANLIMRREETASTRSLLNTARLMEDNPMLFRLKEMEYVEKIAEKISHIDVSGNGVLIDQLRQIFSGSK